MSRRVWKLAAAAEKRVKGRINGVLSFCPFCLQREEDLKGLLGNEHHHLLTGELDGPGCDLKWTGDQSMTSSITQLPVHRFPAAFSPFNLSFLPFDFHCLSLCDLTLWSLCVVFTQTAWILFYWSCCCSACWLFFQPGISIERIFGEFCSIFKQIGLNCKRKSYHLRNDFIYFCCVFSCKIFNTKSSI